jgi:FkbM family methyltransferase
MHAPTTGGAIDLLRKGVVSYPRGAFVRNVCTSLLKLAAKRVRYLDSVSEIRPLDWPGLSFEPVDSMVMDAVYWFGVQGYEGILAKIWEDLCGKAVNVLEIGGNVGLYTVIGGKAARGRYTAVEPIPEVMAVLRANVLRNGLSTVELLEAAVIPGDTEREITLNLPNEGRAAPVGAHLVDGSEVSGRSTLRTVVARGLPFSTLIEGRDLIKIDAEGVECQLLSSAWDHLAGHRPTIVVEVLPEAVELGKLLDKLAADCGYRIQVVPAYGSDLLVDVPAGAFDSATPARYHSKDVILTARPAQA